MRTLAATVTLALLLALLTHTQAQGLTGLYLDVGNDTDYEWNIPSTSSGPHTLDITQWVLRYVRGGCWCVGCVHDASSGNCSVPLVVRADEPGNFTVNNIEVNYSRSRIIDEIGYGQSFKRAGGGCWNVKYRPGSPTFTGMQTIPQDMAGCPETFVYDENLLPITTESAVNDAIYRLLNGTLDANSDGTCEFTEFNENYTFVTDGDIGVQTLWGPLKMRLVIWS